ncbi:MAG: prepilin-type N-terminal cleavage/methylation domain-containing protein [Verrucomicrobiota bacterium]
MTGGSAHERGFTLIELLLVIVITLLASALAVPSFIRSYRGAKLRTSARAVVMSHRYARGMAVLKQVPVAILFDVEKQELEIVSVAAATPDDRQMFLDQRAERTGVESVDKAAGEEQAKAAPSAVSSELIRPLAEGVKIADFESGKAEQEIKGIYWVNYQPNGMCDPYTVTLRDEYNKQATVTVDPLSGKAKVEYD